MMHHFSWFQHFLKPILHFTGASFLCVTRLLFGSPSFYRNIILLAQLCPPNFSPSFYDSTFKNSSSVFYRFTFVTLKLTETNNNFHTKPVGGGPKFVGKQYCLHYFTEFEPELRYSVHTLGWWVAEITPTHTMSTCIQSTLPHKVPFSPPVVKFPSFLLVEFGRKHISASFYRFNFGS